MCNQGVVKRFLRIEIKRTKDEGFSICQQGYINTIIHRFGLLDAKPAKSSLDPQTDLANTLCEDKPANRKEYLSVVGSLMYVALGSRPDITFSITALSRYNVQPLEMHATVTKRVLRYLKNTAGFQIHYQRFPIILTITSQLTSSQLTSSQLTSSQLTSSQLTSSQLTSSQLTSSQLTSSQLTSSQLTSSQLTSSQLIFLQLTLHQHYRIYRLRLCRKPYDSQIGWRICVWPGTHQCQRRTRHVQTDSLASQVSECHGTVKGSSPYPGVSGM